MCSFESTLTTYVYILPAQRASLREGRRRAAALAGEALLDGRRRRNRRRGRRFARAPEAVAGWGVQWAGLFPWESRAAQSRQAHVLMRRRDRVRAPPGEGGGGGGCVAMLAGVCLVDLGGQERRTACVARRSHSRGVGGVQRREGKRLRRTAIRVVEQHDCSVRLLQLVLGGALPARRRCGRTVGTSAEA